MQSRLLGSVAALVALCRVCVADAAMWDESVQGDLSNIGLAPSMLLLDAGANLIRGSFGAPDLDYLSVVVPQGYSLSAIITGLGNNQGLSRSFIGVQAGAVMSVPPTTPDATGLLGWTHFGAADGIDLLPLMAPARFGSTGFVGALPAGAYTFWINETSSDPGLTFDLSFQVTPVPLPAAFGLLLSGLAFLRLVRGRRQVT